MAALEKRVEKLESQMEQVVRVLDQFATNQAELDKVLVTLAESHVKTQEQFQEVAVFMRETDRHLRETDRQLRETDGVLRERIREQKARDKEIDARINRLISGIGEFIRQQSGSKPN